MIEQALKSSLETSPQDWWQQTPRPDLCLLQVVHHRVLTVCSSSLVTWRRRQQMERSWRGQRLTLLLLYSYVNGMLFRRFGQNWLTEVIQRRRERDSLICSGNG